MTEITNLEARIEQVTPCGWVKLYHPGGVLVTLPVVPGIVLSHAAEMMGVVNDYLAAGFLAVLPGLEEGETIETVTHIVRRAKRNDDGTITPLIDVYTGGNFRLLSCYLNTLDDIAVFHNAVYDLEKLPVFDGDAPVERGKNIERDRRYVIPITGVRVVWRLNPRYEGELDKKHAKRQFVRWERMGEAQVTQPVRQPEQTKQNGTTEAASPSPLNCPTTAPEFKDWINQQRQDPFDNLYELRNALANDGLEGKSWPSSTKTEWWQRAAKLALAHVRQHK